MQNETKTFTKSELESMPDSSIAKLHPTLSQISSKDLLYIGDGEAPLHQYENWQLQLNPEFGPVFTWDPVFTSTSGSKLFSDLQKRSYSVKITYGPSDGCTWESVDTETFAGKDDADESEDRTFQVEAFNESHAEQLALDRFHGSTAISNLDDLDISTEVVEIHLDKRYAVITFNTDRQEFKIDLMQSPDEDSAINEVMECRHEEVDYSIAAFTSTELRELADRLEKDDTLPKDRRELAHSLGRKFYSQYEDDKLDEENDD